MVCSRDGRRAYIGCNDGSIRIWDLQRGEEIGQMKEHEGCVLSLDLAGDGTRLASGGTDGIVRIWDLGTREVKHWCRGHKGDVDTVKFGFGGLASGGADRVVRYWNTETGELIREFTGHSGGIMSIATAPNSQQIVSVGEGRQVFVWDGITGAKVSQFNGNPPGPNNVSAHECLRLLGDGRTAVTLGADERIRIWNIRTGEERGVIADKSDGYRFALSAAGNAIVFKSGDQFKVRTLPR
jgi:WD40 repeat protein